MALHVREGWTVRIIRLLAPRDCFPLDDYRLHVAGHHSVINPLRFLSLSPARTPCWSNMFPLIRSRTYIVACGHLLKARQKTPLQFESNADTVSHQNYILRCIDIKHSNHAPRTFINAYVGFWMSEDSHRLIINLITLQQLHYETDFLEEDVLLTETQFTSKWAHD